MAILIFAQVLFSAWKSDALASHYFKEKLMKITDQLTTFESHEMAPPGWKTVWDRYGPINFLLQTFSRKHEKRDHFALHNICVRIIETS